jgi:ParB family chromosome partitioning protein
MKFHRFANAFPLISGDDLSRLVDDIKAHGQREPIRTYDGAILDGRNRFRACELAGIDPWIEPSAATTDEDALRESVSANLHRRHLTASQRAMVGAALEPMFAEMAKARQAAGGKVKANLPEARQAREDAAEAVNVGARSIQHAKTVTEHGTPELRAAVVAGDIAVSAASQASTLAPDAQRDIVERVKGGEKASTAIKAHVANNSGNNEWYTPAQYIEAARRCMGTIDTDPASSEFANRTVKAGTYYDAESNGLEQPWSGNVWLNPPYAQPLIQHFAEALADRYVIGQIDEGILLTNNATETRWFQYAIRSASALCFPSGRIKFLDETGKPANTPLQGQCFMYFGNDPESFAHEFSEFGAIVTIHPTTRSEDLT